MAYVIGIAGGTASGKSTLCEKLENQLSDLRVKSIHMDTFSSGAISPKPYHTSAAKPMMITTAPIPSNGMSSIRRSIRPLPVITMSFWWKVCWFCGMNI